MALALHEAGAVPRGSGELARFLRPSWAVVADAGTQPVVCKSALGSVCHHAAWLQTAGLGDPIPLLDIVVA